MEFAIEKIDFLTMKSEELSNGERIRMLGEKENFNYFGILEALEAETINQTKMKGKQEQGKFLSQAI